MTDPRWCDLEKDLGGDASLAREAARSLVNSWPALQKRLRDAQKERQSVETARALHALKGAFGVFPSNGFYSQLKELERLARESKDSPPSESLDRVLKTLEAYVERLQMLTDEVKG